MGELLKKVYVTARKTSDNYSNKLEFFFFDYAHFEVSFTRKSVLIYVAEKKLRFF